MLGCGHPTVLIYEKTTAQQLSNVPFTKFFKSGKSYYGVLWTSPYGNAYYTLAHHYIAAKLNFESGADPTPVQTTFNTATSLLELYHPWQIAQLPW